MAYTDILYGVDDFVATITLYRPDKLNAWTSEMDAEVRAAIESAAADDSVRAIILTGAGRGFCAGADMSRLSRLSAGETPRAIVGANGSKSGNFEQKFSYLLGVPKPIFAAINGPIAGIAFCLSLFCDFRYMAEGAKLTTAFAKRGLIAEHGSSWMLPRLIGPMNALDLLYSARMVDAAEAALRDVPGVRSVDSVQLRWIGHRMRVETTLTVDHALNIVEAHAIADQAHHQLIHGVPRLDDATVHVNPAAQPGVDHHAATGHHRVQSPAGTT